MDLLIFARREKLADDVRSERKLEFSILTGFFIKKSIIQMISKAQGSGQSAEGTGLLTISHRMSVPLIEPVKMLRGGQGWCICPPQVVSNPMRLRLRLDAALLHRLTGG